MDVNSQRLQGKTIVITGASSGFGRGSAMRLAAMGANIVAAARRTEVLEEVRSEIKSKGGSIHVVTCDVSKISDIEKLAADAIREYGTIDIWINNVGVGALGYFWDIPLNDHARLIDVNLKGLIYGAHTALHHFIKKGHGILINMGSIDSEVPLALQNTYAATKSAVLSLGSSLNEELRLSGKENIKVATIMPWAADTPWWIHAANYTGHKPRMTAMDDPEKIIDKIIHACIHPTEKIPVGTKAGASNAFHRLFPNLIEHVSGKTAKKESQKAGPLPPSPGSIYEPMKEGTGIEGGLRERMKKEDDHN